MTELMTKTCSKCKVGKAAGDFGKDRSRKTGLRNSCRLCVKDENMAWAKKNPEKKSAMHRAWVEKNPERNAANGRFWWACNPEKYATYLVLRIKKDKESLSKNYIKSLLCGRNKIPFSQIPQSLVELKRAQIQITNFLKEQSK